MKEKQNAPSLINARAVRLQRLRPALLLAALLGLAVLQIGCEPVVHRVGPNGVTVSTANAALGRVKLEPGTRLQPIEEVTRGNWRYEVKEGKYEGNYVVLSDEDVVN